MSKSYAKGQYEKYSYRREPFLSRGRDAAMLTIPSILPPAGHTYSSQLRIPYQGLGARGVTNVSSRVSTALLPPGTPFFRYDVPPETVLRSGKQTVDGDTERLLSLAAALAMSEVERRAWRQPTFISSQHLVVAGNILEYVAPDNTIRNFTLDQYVVCRDRAGHVLELIIVEKVAPQTLSEAARSVLPTKSQKDDAEDVELYTWIKRKKDGTYVVHQELIDKPVPNSKGTFKKLPFNALRWNPIPGEAYGRGKVEEHMGDLRALESLERAILEGSALAARNFIMVRPNATGGNLKRRIEKAENGDVIVGNIEDASFFTAEKIAGNLQIAEAKAEKLRMELSAAFLLNASRIRDAERVTTAEIRMIAEELEATLGGVYSMLSADMQTHRVERLTMQMQDQGKMPQWDESQVAPTIITGLEALRNEQTLMRIDQFSKIAQVLDPNGEYVKKSDALNKASVALGLGSIVRSEDEAAQLRQQNAQVQAMARAQAGGIDPSQLLAQAKGAAQ